MILWINIPDVKDDKVDAIMVTSFLFINQNRIINDSFSNNELTFFSKERDNLIKR